MHFWFLALVDHFVSVSKLGFTSFWILLLKYVS